MYILTLGQLEEIARGKVKWELTYRQVVQKVESTGILEPEVLGRRLLFYTWGEGYAFARSFRRVLREGRGYGEALSTARSESMVYRSPYTGSTATEPRTWAFLRPPTVTRDYSYPPPPLRENDQVVEDEE